MFSPFENFKGLIDAFSNKVDTNFLFKEETIMKSVMKKMVVFVFLAAFSILFATKVEANQIYEAEEFDIGKTITNNSPEYMNYYKLTMQERTTVDVTVTGYSEGYLDIFRLYLYDANFEEIDCDNPYGITILQGAKKESKKYTLDAGVYYIAIQDNNTNMSKYTLSIKKVATKNLWNYYGDSFSNAKKIMAGEKISGFLRGEYYSKTKQYFKVQLTEKTILSLNFTYADDSDITVSFYDKNFNSIADYSVKANDKKSKTIEKNLNKGTYYISTYYGYNTNDGVDYSFSFNQKCLTPKLNSYKEGAKKNNRYHKRKSNCYNQGKQH